jgi:uncharacterized protein with HEPN domain
MRHRTLKYILDIESVIAEIEQIKLRIENNFLNYQADFLVKRATERDLEIIGEAIRKLLELNPNISLSNSSKIIGLRNLISHAYDTVEDELIWGIIQKNIPELKEEIISLKNSNSY